MASFALRICLMMAILATAHLAHYSCHIDNRDIPGGDIRRTSASSFTQCKSHCSGESRCIAVAYHPATDRCYLKTHGYGNRKWAAHVDTATLPCQELWTSCPAGKRVGGNHKSCNSCSSNTYSSGGRNQNCNSCQAGTFSGSGSSSCRACPAGQYGARSGGGCSNCPPGKYTSSTGSTSCSSCPANRYSAGSGATRCSYCPAGQYSQSGASSCKSCPAGQYGSSRGGGCEICPYNSYNDQVRQTSCKRCMEGYVSEQGSTSAANCFKQPPGLHCWTTKDDSSLAGSLEDAVSFEEAFKACAADSECFAVKCKRRPGDTGCSIGEFTGQLVSQDLCRYPKM